EFGNEKGRQEVTLKITANDVASWCAQPASEVQKIINQFKKANKLEIFADRIVIKNIVDMQRLVAQKRRS
ncbi:MAG: hypothetical protein KDK45_23280, partial [Leptospiraceae bacterium]|nr:hypothetical protein [Leptospiraceae bacterium]